MSPTARSAPTPDPPSTIDRGFYVTDYQGTTIDTVTLQH
jgi:hypothetical protein